MTRCVLMLMIAAWCAAASGVFAQNAGAGAGEPASARAVLERAEESFEAGMGLLDSDPASARARLGESVAAYRVLIDMGHENAAIHRNIGTAFLRTGDVGRAIVSFRRAEAIDPDDQLVRDSLSAARAMVRTEVVTGTRERVGDAVLFWRGYVPRGVLLGVGLVAWVLAWGAGAVRLVSKRGTAAAFAFAVLGVVTLGSLGLERTLAELNTHAVVVGDSVRAYRGPSGSVYEPAFEQPLEPGVEATVIETRDGWARLRLRSGAEAWVPESAVEVI